MHGDETGFGGAVVGEMARAEFAEHGGDGDDCSAVFGGGEHSWEKGADGVEVGEEVDVHVALDFLRAEFPDAFAVDDAGVVDEDGGCAELEMDIESVIYIGIIVMMKMKIKIRNKR